MNEWLLRGDTASAPTDLSVLLLGLLLAFLAGQAIAWVYMFTHSGLSYSRAFVNSLVLMPVLVSLTMMVLSSNIVTAFGLMAIFAIVRFRNVLRDTLDTSYILAVLVMGLAAGTQRYSSAIIGTLLVAGLMLYLNGTSFGIRHRYDLILNLHWSRPLNELPALLNVLNRHSRKTHCASQRSNEGYEGTDLSYRLLLRNAERVDELLAELRALAGVSRITSMMAEEESEL
jgi:hypothetical protein